MYVSGVFTPYTVKESIEIVTDSRQLPSTERTSENFVSKSPEIMIIDPNDSGTEDSEEAGEPLHFYTKGWFICSQLNTLLKQFKEHTHIFPLYKDVGVFNHRNDKNGPEMHGMDLKNN